MRWSRLAMHEIATATAHIGRVYTLQDFNFVFPPDVTINHGRGKRIVTFADCRRLNDITNCKSPSISPTALNSPAINGEP